MVTINGDICFNDDFTLEKNVLLIAICALGLQVEAEVLFNL